MTVIGTSAHTLWAISLGIGFRRRGCRGDPADDPVSTVDRIDRSVKALLGVAGQVAATPSTSRSCRRPPLCSADS